MTFKQFCELNSISLSFLYDLLKDGRGPATLRIGSKRLITAEAAAAWRKRFEESAA
jgi:excisionase family DNA binding protein